MAYRFTDTDKWNDAWFSGLKPLSKLLFLYLCDQCDIAGFIEINERKICFDLGIGKQEAEKSLKEIETRLLLSKDGRFIFIRNFLKHQKNIKLNPGNNAHKGIIKRLEENLELFGFKCIEEFINKPLDSPSLGASEPLARGTGNGNGKEEDNKGGMGEKEGDRTWRDDFDVYLSEVTSSYESLVSNEDFIKDREKYFPNTDIKLSLQKVYEDFWSKECGWKHKKKSKTKTLDWMSTFKKSLDHPFNQVRKQLKRNESKTTESEFKLHPALRS